MTNRQNILLAMAKAIASIVKKNQETTPEEIQIICEACEELGNEAVWQQ